MTRGEAAKRPIREDPLGRNNGLPKYSGTIPYHSLPRVCSYAPLSILRFSYHDFLIYAIGSLIYYRNQHGFCLPMEASHVYSTATDEKTADRVILGVPLSMFIAAGCAQSPLEADVSSLANTPSLFTHDSL